MLRDRRGQGGLEIIAVIPGLLLIFAILVVFGRLTYIQIALDAAAHDAARTAVESLDPGRGPYQAHLAAMWTLAGFNLRPEQASVVINTNETWNRGTEVEVRVSYRPSMRDVLGVGVFFDYENRTLVGRSVMRVEGYKSRWPWAE